eukprot:GHVL01027692.1.p1 GENE.GHVL01027692.1~~GHVL01027692.1.p1  ORF type:complete len:403 (-),score=84.00 GHVL01027692.1:93-1226(-)
MYNILENSNFVISSKNIVWIYPLKKIYIYFSQKNNIINDELLLYLYQFSRLFSTSQLLLLIILCFKNNVFTKELSAFCSEPLCERINTLDTTAVTQLINILTSTRITDEFWLFMLSKTVQKNVSDYSCDDLITIVSQYAKSELIDETFYNIILEKIKKNIHLYTNSQLIQIMYHLREVRVTDEEIFKTIFHRLEEKNEHFEKISHLIVAAAFGDYRSFDCDYYWKTISYNQCQVLDNDLGLCLFTLFCPTALHLYFPFWCKSNIFQIIKGRDPRRIASAARKLPHLMELICRSSNGSPSPRQPLFLSLASNTIKSLHTVIFYFKTFRDRKFQPDSSALHKEVALALKGLQIEHRKEVSAMPYYIDVFIDSKILNKMF